MDTPVIVILTLGVAALLGRMAYGAYFTEAGAQNRSMKDVRLRRIADVKDGEMARIVGKIRPLGETLVSPLTGRPCVYFDVAVERQRRSMGGIDWETVHGEYDSRDFIVEDDTGRAIVRVARLQPVVKKDVVRTNWYSSEGETDMAVYCKSRGIETPDSLFDGMLSACVKEGIFAPGATVSVVGRVRREVDPEAPEGVSGYRAAPRRLVFDAEPPDCVYASNDPSTFDP